MKKVSIIIPIYNSDKYLKKCLDSILNQTYKNIEIILVNDGSTDNSLNICKEYKEKDNRIKIINNTNHGVSYSRNCGIKIANGDYIVFVDSDDTVDENYINFLMLANKNDNFDLVICALCSKIETSKKVSSENIVLDNENVLTGNLKDDYEILFEYLLGPYLKLFKRSIIDEYNILFPEKLLVSEDQVFNREYLKHVRKYKFINKCLYNYYHRENNSLSVKIDNKYWICDMYNIDSMKKFLDMEKIKNKDRILTNHAISLLHKYIFITGNFFLDYKYFYKKYIDLKK